MLALPIALLATGCVTPTPIIADKAPCSELLPEAWAQPVPGAPAPAPVDRARFAAGLPGDVLHADALARGWMQFGIAQTAQLEKANGRNEDSRGIVERCEARDREAVRRSRPRFLGLF